MVVIQREVRMMAEIEKVKYKVNRTVKHIYEMSEIFLEQLYRLCAYIYRTIIPNSNVSLNVIIEITIINRTEFRMKANSINCVLFTSVIKIEYSESSI